MADQTVNATSDVSISSASNNEGNTVIRMKSRAANESNILARFDVSSLAGKTWDSVVLQGTYSTDQAGFGGSVVYLSRVLQPIVYTTCTNTLYDTGLSWDATLAENSTDNDHSTRVDIGGTLGSGTLLSGTALVTPDLTDIVKDGRNEAGSIFDIIIYSDDVTQVSTTMQLHANEATGDTGPKLFFTNVQDQASSASDNPILSGSAVNVAVPSASVRSKSGRPPMAGAGRQVSASVIHDGVEPMTILAITLKGEFGADN